MTKAPLPIEAERRVMAMTANAKNQAAVISKSFRVVAPRRWGPMRRRLRLNLTVTHILIAVVASALALWPIHYIIRLPDYTVIGTYNEMMADFCESEAVLMMGRREACLTRAANGDPWEDTSESAETLKICPYPSDAPRYGSWREQAAVWERAARKARKAAERYAGWGFIPTARD